MPLVKTDDFVQTSEVLEEDFDWEIVEATLETDEETVRELEQKDNLIFSGQSRQGRIGIDQGIYPETYLRRQEIPFDPSYAIFNYITHKDLFLADLDLLKTHIVRSGHYSPIGGGPELDIGIGDSLGRLIGFDDEDVAVHPNVQEEEMNEIKEIAMQQQERGGPRSTLRYATENGDHSDITELVEGTQYEEAFTKVLLPITRYAETTVEGEITKKELDEMDKEDILQVKGEPPQKMDPGVHYAVWDNYQPLEDHALILTNPHHGFARHVNARFIDSDFPEGATLAYEFAANVPGRFPDKIPAYAIKANEE